MNGQDLPSLLQHFPLLAALSAEERTWLARTGERKLAPKHSFLYLADEPGDFLCFPISGAVKIGIYSPDGREIIKNIAHPYGVFGELTLTGEKCRVEFAAAMNREVDYLEVKAADFQQLMDNNAGLAQAVMAYLGDRLRRAERQWESLILKDVRSRIVEFLKESADQRGRQVGYETLVKHGLTQQDIANLVGASRQTVTAILNELRKSNLIHFNRNTILIRDVNKLN
ncbi:MAG TPA: Crp/Fnr family transcriptional regulator [Saprospiraceae bacterium]|nr:Crp/Fnr family transcriptional regulator [Saprospiraceae bacterium]HND88440.1 Crp/Fnr family transcriptional regulator [Saprospiraceae bacterium]